MSPVAAGCRVQCRCGIELCPGVDGDEQQELKPRGCRCQGGKGGGGGLGRFHGFLGGGEAEVSIEGMGNVERFKTHGLHFESI